MAPPHPGPVPRGEIGSFPPEVRKRVAIQLVPVLSGTIFVVSGLVPLAAEASSKW